MLEGVGTPEHAASISAAAAVAIRVLIEMPSSPRGNCHPDCQRTKWEEPIQGRYRAIREFQKAR